MILAIQKAAQDKFRLHSQGMTLIELLLAMAVTLIIIGALVTAFISHTQTSAAEEARMELQQNLRVAVDRLSHVLRHSGFGCYDTFEKESMSGDDPENDDITVESFVKRDPKKNDFDSDSIIVTYGFKMLAEVDGVLDDDRIKLDTDPSPSITTNDKFKQYLSFYPNMEGNTFYEADDVDDRRITLTKDVPFTNSEVDSQVIEVYMVSPARIFIKDNVLQVQIFAYQDTAVDRTQHWIIAENMKDLDFKYSSDGENWEDNIDDIDPQNIRKIKFTVWGEKEVNGETIRMKSQGEVSLRNAF